MAQNGERSFKHYLELPQEIRFFIIDDMRLDDSTRFTRCSKLCQKEVRSSKVVKSLAFYSSSEKDIQLSVRHRRSTIFGNDGHFINFSKHLRISRDRIRIENKFMKIKENGKGEPFIIQLDESTNLVETAFQHFKNLLKSYQSDIKCLEIRGGILENFDFGITDMNKLEELTVNGPFNALQFLSKTSDSLKTLRVCKETFEEVPLDKIYRLRHIIDMPELKLNYEQFSQLSARYVKIHIGELTPENLHNFVQSWRNGTSWRKKSFEWKLEGTQFNVPQFFQLFGINEPNYQESGYNLELQHNTNARRTVELNFRGIERFPVILPGVLKISF